jgi:hypothetical protein
MRIRWYVRSAFSLDGKQSVFIDPFGGPNGPVVDLSATAGGPRAPVQRQ